MTSVLVPVGRFARWVENFSARHGATDLSVVAGRLSGTASDGSRFVASLSFDDLYDGPPVVADFLESAAPPASWGVLLVRKGGFAVARLSGVAMLEHKIGQRHVQGRTKAGGQSQQRFARRRDNQARAAYEAAADHAFRLLTGVSVVVTGGDHAAVDDVLSDRRLAGLTPTGTWLAVPDPKRAVLDQAIKDAQSIRVQVTNADEGA